MNTPWITTIYYASAVYDAAIAAVFLFAAAPVFAAAGVALPAHMGYLHFPALILLVFAAMYARIARDPYGNRDFMPYGMGLKAAYILVAFGHWFAGNLPSLWVPIAWIDLAFLVAFVAAWRVVRAPMPA
jgi:hypothetical protein